MMRRLGVRHIPYSFRDVQGLSVAPAWYTGYNSPPFNIPWAQTKFGPIEGFEPTPSEPVVVQDKHS